MQKIKISASSPTIVAVAILFFAPLLPFMFFFSLDQIGSVQRVNIIIPNDLLLKYTNIYRNKVVLPYISIAFVVLFGAQEDACGSL